MIFRSGELRRNQVEAAEEALQGRSGTRWQQLLRLPIGDGLAAVLDEKVYERVFASAPGHSFNGWILNIRSWRDRVQSPRAAPPVESALLHDAWEEFAARLEGNLRRARIQTGVPQSGGVLVFLGGLVKCVVVQYHFVGTVAKLTPIAVIEEPKSAFDVWAAIDQADAPARNVLKAMLASGHKIVVHRDVLGHVDRRAEQNVFGPSIDTLVMAEILAEEIFEGAAIGAGDVPVTAALEVGTGSGFLAAGLIRHLPALREVFCSDVDFGAVACTEKNIRIAQGAPGAGRRTDVRLFTGPFDSRLLNRRFDLVVCNPPYIPELPGARHGGAGGGDYLRAVGGLDLLTYVIQETPNILTPRGRALIMTSSVALAATLQAIPERCRVARPLGEGGYEVLFDVEAVLNRPDWLAYLRGGGGLVKRGDAYFHTLHPIWLSLS